MNLIITDPPYPDRDDLPDEAWLVGNLQWSYRLPHSDKARAEELCRHATRMALERREKSGRLKDVFEFVHKGYPYTASVLFDEGFKAYLVEGRQRESILTALRAAGVPETKLPPP